MREATVGDYISLSEINESMEEAATTMFLNSVCGENSLEWTADDRRFALLWYYVHTERDHFYRIEYECSCGQTHSVAIDLMDVLDAYRPIDGKAERSIVVRGDKYVVVPFSGSSAEALELERIGIQALESEHGADSPEAGKARLQMRLNEIIYRIQGEGLEERIPTMSIGYAKELIDSVEKATDEMAHGLDTKYLAGEVFLLSPPLKCDKEVVTRCRVRFRNYDFIPQL